MGESTDRSAWELDFRTGFGKEIPNELQDLYLRHARLLLDANRQLNLTALHNAQDMSRKLYYASWKIGSFFSPAGRSVLDLGTGAGFPGIPLAAAHPQGRFVLLDATRKKVDFVARSAQTLGLKNVQAVWARAEEYLKDHRFDFVVSQAASPTKKLLELLSPVRKSFPLIGLMKGEEGEKEFEPGEELSGFRRKEIFPYSLPNSEKRSFVLFESLS